MTTLTNKPLGIAICLVAACALASPSEKQNRPSASMEEDVIRAEHQSARAFIARDWVAVDQFLAYEFLQDWDQCTFEEKQQAMDGWMKSRVADNGHPTSLVYRNLNVRFVGELAVVTGKAEYTFQSAPPGAFIFTDVLVFRNKAWRLVSGHSSNIIH
jgi:hypothetical protein